MLAKLWLGHPQPGVEYRRGMEKSRCWKNVYGQKAALLQTTDPMVFDGLGRRAQ